MIGAFFILIVGDHIISHSEYAQFESTQGVFDLDLRSFSDAFFDLIDIDENGKSI